MDKHPLFTVVIPTRERHRTLGQAIESVLAEDHDSVEVVVMDNAGGKPTEEVVAGFSDARLRYVRAPRRLAMSDNWEMGVAQARGEFVFVLGDDDALAPGALGLAERCLLQTQAPILAWARALYWWPDATEHWMRNRLYFCRQWSEVAICRSQEVLDLFYGFQVTFSILPMIYNAFVHRSVIAKATGLAGRYFADPTPDVYSGVINAMLTDTYLYTYRPLSLAGTSASSTGAAQALVDLTPDSPARRFVDELAHSPLAEQPRPILDTSTHPSVLMANAMLQALAVYGPERTALRFDVARFVHYLLANANGTPGVYREIVAIARRIAHNQGLPWDPAAVPPEVTGPPLVPEGQVDGGIWLDTAKYGVTDVLGARALLDAYDRQVAAVGSGPNPA